MGGKTKEMLVNIDFDWDWVMIGLAIYALLIVFSPDFVLGTFSVHVIEFRLSDLYLLGLFSYLIYFLIESECGLFYPSIFFPALAYVASFFLAAIVSLVKIIGISFGIESTFFALKYLEYFLIFFITANLVRSEKHVNFLLEFLLGSVTISGGLLILTRFFDRLNLSLTIDLFSFNPDFTSYPQRATIPFAKGPGPSAEILYLLIPFALFFFVNTDRKRKKIIYSLYLIVLGSALILTGSRGPMAATFLSLAFLGPLLERKVIPWLVGGLVGAGVLAITFPYVGKKISSIFLLFSEGLCSSDSMCVRITEVWPRGIEKFLENPIFGACLASFPTSDAQYIRILADQVIIGLATFVFFIASLFFYLLKFRGKASSAWEEGIFSAIMISIFALLINGVTVTAFEPVRAMEPFWFLLGLVFALEKFDRPEERKLSVYSCSKIKYKNSR